MIKKIIGIVFVLLSFTTLGAKVRNYGIAKEDVVRIVYDTTKVVFDEYHDEWNDVLLGTLSAETDLGAFRGNSKHGIAQITPVAYKFIKKQVLSDKETYEKLKENGLDFKKIGFNDLTNNHRASITAMALYYKYVTKSKKFTIHKKDKAEVWKKYYNTYAGAGTKAHFNKAYNRNKSLIEDTLLVCKADDIKLADKNRSIDNEVELYASSYNVFNSTDTYIASETTITETDKYITFTSVVTKKTNMVINYYRIITDRITYIKSVLRPQVYIS